MALPCSIQHFLSILFSLSLLVVVFFASNSASHLSHGSTFQKEPERTQMNCSSHLRIVETYRKEKKEMSEVGGSGVGELFTWPARLLSSPSTMAPSLRQVGW